MDRLEKLALAAPLIMIVILIALFLGWWEYRPEDDPATQEECVESHSELASISKDGIPSFHDVCDKTRLKQCVRWKQERTWAGTLHKVCEEYE